MLNNFNVTISINRNVLYVLKQIYSSGIIIKMNSCLGQIKNTHRNCTFVRRCLILPENVWLHSIAHADQYEEREGEGEERSPNHTHWDFPVKQDLSCGLTYQ